MRFRIVVLPEEKLKKIALDYSKKICDEFDTKFKLNENHLPHATIIVNDFDDLEGVKKVLSGIAEEIGKIKINIKGFFADPGNKSFISFIFEDNSGFEILRRKVVGDLKDLGRGKFWFQYPHITLTSLNDENDFLKILELNLKIPEGDFEFVKIGISGDGEFGAVRNIIEEFNLVFAFLPMTNFNP